MRARYYIPLLRRFLNVDPARENWNWYGYAGGNPIAFVDPTGLGISSALDAVQTTLSFLGMIPVVGIFFDAVNVGISIGRGNYGEAALSAAAAIPGIGLAAGGAYLGVRSLGRVHRRLNHRFTWGTPPGGHWSQGMGHRFRSKMGLVGTPTQLHHWLVPQRARWVPNYIKNQRWNLKVTANRAAHARIDTAFSFRGVDPYPLIIRPWMAMPNWARAGTVGTGIGMGYGIHKFTDDE